MWCQNEIKSVNYLLSKIVTVSIRLQKQQIKIAAVNNGVLCVRQGLLP